MNLLKLANPLHVVRGAAGVAGTAAGAAEAVVSRSVGVGRAVLHAAAVEGRPQPGRQQPQSEQQQFERRLPGADTAAFEPQPPAEPPVDVVGAALAAEQKRPVTEGGAVVESLWSDDEEPLDGPPVDPAEA